jgi:hypothetical protein
MRDNDERSVVVKEEGEITSEIVGWKDTTFET